MVGFGCGRADEYECLFMEERGLVIMAVMVITVKKELEKGRVIFYSG